MPGSRAIGLAIVVLSSAALAFSLWRMAIRLDSYNAAAAHPLYDILQISDMGLTYEGHPVELTIDDASAPPRLQISYRGGSASLPLDGRTNDLLPPPVRWDAFLRILRIERYTPGPEAARDVRIVIAHRAEPEGQVDRKAWAYTILELVPPDEAGGPIVEHAFRFGRPRSEEPDPQNPVLTDLQGDWRYAAALEVTPTLQRPKNTFAGEGIVAMDWTWPAAGVSVLALTLGIAVLASSFVQRGEGAQGAP